MNASNGSVLWHTTAIGAVYGSVTTADFGEGYQDVIVPTTDGIEILDGRSGQEVAHFDDGTNLDGTKGTFGFQNAALVTGDPDGSIGITVSGYFATKDSSFAVQGMVQHFEVAGSNGGLADEGGAWPQFHHDAQLTGFVGGGAGLGELRPAGRRAERLPHRRVGRRDLRLRTGLLRQHGEHRPQQTGRRHGRRPRRRRLLARRVRRRHLHLRGRAVLRLDRLTPSQRADRRHGGHAGRRRLLARGVRRGHLQLRRRAVLRLGGRRPPTRTSWAWRPARTARAIGR